MKVFSPVVVGIVALNDVCKKGIRWELSLLVLVCLVRSERGKVIIYFRREILKNSLKSRRHTTNYLRSLKRVGSQYNQN